HSNLWNTCIRAADVPAGRRSVRYAVQIGHVEADDEALGGDHGATGVVPVRVLACDATVDVRQLLDGGVVTFGRGRRQSRVGFGHRVRPRPRFGHVEARTRILHQISDLRAIGSA